MNLLAFETSVGNCSVALLHHNKKHFVMSKNTLMQSEELIVMIGSILKENGITYQDLDAISCTLGPGSFTGIRVGIAAARGMKKVLRNTKLIGVSTLEIMVHDTPDKLIKNKKILSILKAYGDEFYTQQFSPDKKPLSEIQLMSKEDLYKNMSLYDLIITDKQHDFNCHVIEINALSVLNKAEQLLPSAEGKNDITPLYIKAPSIHRKN